MELLRGGRDTPMLNAPRLGRPAESWVCIPSCRVFPLDASQDAARWTPIFKFGLKQQRQGAAGPDHVWPHAGKFGRVKPNAVSVVACPPIVDQYIGAVFPAELLETVHERRCTTLRFRIAPTASM